MAKARALGRPARVRRPDPKAREREAGPIQYAETRARAEAERVLHPTERLRQPLEQARPMGTRRDDAYLVEAAATGRSGLTPAQLRRIAHKRGHQVSDQGKRRSTRRARLARGDAAGWGVPAEQQKGLLAKLFGRTEGEQANARMLAAGTKRSRAQARRFIRPGNRAERRRQARERGE